MARFVNIYDEYSKAPDVTRKRLYLETMNEVLPKTGRKLVIDDDEGHPAAAQPRPGEAGGEASEAPPHRASSLAVLRSSRCWSSVYTISETEQAIITQFGEPVGEPHTDPACT